MEVRSAGSEPAEQINLAAVQAMREVGNELEDPAGLGDAVRPIRDEIRQRIENPS